MITGGILRETIGGLFRARNSAVSAVFVIGMLFLLLGIVLLASENFHRYHENTKSKFEFVVFLRDNTTPIELHLLIVSIKKLNGYLSYSYHDRSEAYLEMQGLLGGQLLPDDGPNPFPNSIAIKFQPATANLEHFIAVEQELSGQRCTEGVDFGREWFQSQEPLLEYFKTVATFLGVLIFIAVILITFWTIRRIALLKEQETRVLLLLGANWRQVGIPYIAEGSILGILGSLFGLLLLYILWIVSAGMPVELEFIPFPVAILIPVAGFLAGTNAAFFAVRKMFR